MQTRALKLSAISLFGALAIVYCFIGSAVGAFSGGAPPARTGAPALGTFPTETTCVACHSSFPVNSGPGMLTISGLPASYMPGQEIAVTVTLKQADRQRFGFEATVLDDAGRRAGDLVVTDATRTRVIDGTGNFTGRQYVGHILGGVAPNGTDQGSWTFTWRAPAIPVGTVTFYVAGNGANNGNGNQGDFIYTVNASLPAASSLPAAASVSAASFTPNGMLTVNSIAALFGTNLATSNASATGVPLPTTLGGLRVSVKDNVGTARDAGLFAVTSGQINYLVPTGTVNGTATVTVFRDTTAIASGNVLIDTVAPGIFAANQNGQGVAAAVVLRFRANGEQVFEPAVRLDATTNRFVAVPIDLGPETDQVFLLVYGSGFRGRTALSAATCQIGGTNAEVLYAGDAPGFVGLDQANIRLPRGLAGRGDVNLVLTVNAKAANTVSINVR